MSEADGSAADEKSPKPRKRKKKKRRRPDVVERTSEVGMTSDPAAATRHAPAILAEAAPKPPFFAPQRFVVAGALAIAAGLGLVGTEPSDLGRALWIGGLLLLVVGIHLLGRLGPDLGTR